MESASRPRREFLANAAKKSEFWEMHHLLYEKQDEWSAVDTDNTLVSLAKSLGLKKEAFKACFSGRKALERVLADLYDAQESSVQMAPTFIVIQGGKGTLLRGTKPAEDFVSAVRQLLGAAKAEKPQTIGVSK